MSSVAFIRIAGDTFEFFPIGASAPAFSGEITPGISGPGTADLQDIAANALSLGFAVPGQLVYFGTDTATGASPYVVTPSTGPTV